MKMKELLVLNSDELTQKETALKKEYFELKRQRQIGRVEKPSRFKAIRKDIARILTILNERAKDGSKS